MGALGSLFGMGPAHEVQSKRGTPGFTGHGDDRMGGLMHNTAGMSRPDEYTGGYPHMPGSGLGGLPGLPPGLGGFPGLGGMGGGMQGGMGGGYPQQRQPQGYPYGIQPPQGMMQQQQSQGQQAQQSPLQGLFSMLGGL